MTGKYVHLVSANGDQDAIPISSLEEEKRINDLAKAFSPGHTLWGPVESETARTLFFPDQNTFRIFLSLWDNKWRKD